MKKGISQEGLKLIACITMLIDHFGHLIIYPLFKDAVMLARAGAAVGMLQKARILYVVYMLCRIIGRIAFPLFAFLLVEGVYHTKNRKKYAIRLILGAMLSEIPFNLSLYGSVFGRQQSIMVTLLLGFIAVIGMEKCRSYSWKPVVLLAVALVGKLMSVHYGWQGVLLVGLFALSRDVYSRDLMRFCGMLVLFHGISSIQLRLGNFSIPIQALGALSILFIANYDGRKLTHSKAAQWAFYLFYPVHLLVLWAISRVVSLGIPV